jgi:hypothetical protein
MRFQKQSQTPAILLALYVTIVVGLLYGYVSNIIQIVTAHETTSLWLMVAKVAGIFVFPIGAILGYVGV